MIARLALALALTGALLAAPAARAAGDRGPVLVPDVSQHEVVVDQGFTGAQLLLFGALMTREGTRAGRDYDIVIVVEGPTHPMILREKRKVAGMWVNAASTTLRSVPEFYAVASSRPLAQIVSPGAAAIYEMGLNALQLSPDSESDTGQQAHFARGLVELMGRRGLYVQDEHAVAMTGEVLYRAQIALPSSVKTGTYTAETFAVRDGQVVASAVSTVEVRKQGLEKAINDFARHNGLAYGLMVVSLSVLMGWLAGRVLGRD